MKQKMVILALSAAVHAALVADMAVGTGERRFVEALEEATQADTAVVAPRGTLVKHGPANLVFETGAFAQDWTVGLEVAEGTATVSRTAAPASRTYSSVAGILAAATLHLDASDSGSVLRNGTTVHEWLDTRETGDAENGYSYSRAITNTMAALIEGLSLDESALYPVYKTLDGAQGIYFNGYKSGTWMNLVTASGGQASIKVANIFVVQAVTTETGLGTILGVNVKDASDAGVAFVPYSAAGYHTILWNLPYSVGPIRSSRSYVNGREIDPFHQGLPSGLCVFDVELLAGAGLWENIFNDRGYTGLSSGAIPSPASTYFRTGAGELRAGGEYVFEIIAFETALTGEQRAMVEAFLREKWTGVTRAGSVKVATASGTVLAVSGAEDVSTGWTGAGRILKTGGDSIDLGLNPSAEFSGDFRVAAGSLAIRSSFPYSLAEGEALAATGGKTEQARLDAAIGGPVYSSAMSAGAGSATISGGGTVRLREIPSSVTNLAVASGELVLESPVADAFGSPDNHAFREATIAGGNYSFEYGKSATVQCKGFQNGGSYEGWHHVTASGRSGEVFTYNQSVSGGRNNATWGIPNTSPAGDVALGIKQDASAWAYVSLPKNGRYKLTFLASCRQNANGPAHVFTLAMGKSSDSLTEISSFVIPYIDGRYHRYSFLTPEFEAGDGWQLWFKSTEAGIDRCTMIDDVHLVLADDEDLAAVPNGAFENFVTDTAKFASREYNNLFYYYKPNGTYYGRDALGDWTLEQGDTSTTTPKFAGAFGANVNSIGEWDGSLNHAGRYVDSAGGDGSLVQLYISYGCAASVSWVPPAGTYRVAVDAALRITDSNASKKMGLAGTIVPDGGSAVDLGTASLDDVYFMTDCVLPNSFTADGSTAVTLTLAPVLNSGAQGHLVLDNVRLERVGNLVADGSFEANSSSWKYVGGVRHGYIGNVAAWGPNRATGSYCGRLQKTGAIYQDVTVVEPGMHRLRVAARSRQYTGGTNIDATGQNPVGIDLVDMGASPAATNRIALFTPVYTNFNEYTWCVNVPAAGTYRLIFAGQATADKTSFIDDVDFRREYVTADVPDVPDKLSLDIASGATLRLDFTGTGRISRLKLGGKSVSGVVSAKTHPGYLSGEGSLEVPNYGMRILFH